MKSTRSIANVISRIRSKILNLILNRFVISVAPVISSYHTTHFIIFEDYEEIAKLSRDFKSFEDILKNLEYRDTSLHLRKKNEEFKYVIYNSYYLEN